ncbi:hypothetical protein F4780DRAFT_118341 [Xylariomycetidae sp. FL0641]|nr:hypothetical protein F4780DRAFT_118341 [Xylariomycetidae sp. FL0641]
MSGLSACLLLFAPQPTEDALHCTAPLFGFGQRQRSWATSARSHHPTCHATGWLAAALPPSPRAGAAVGCPHRPQGLCAGANETGAGVGPRRAAQPGHPTASIWKRQNRSSAVRLSLVLQPSPRLGARPY